MPKPPPDRFSHAYIVYEAEQELRAARAKRRMFTVLAVLFGAVGALFLKWTLESGNVYLCIVSISLWLNAIFCVLHLIEQGQKEAERVRKLRALRGTYDRRDGQVSK